MNSKNKKFLIFSITLFVLCFSQISCVSKKLPVKEIPIERDGQVIAVIKAEIAVSMEDRATGLMYRKSL